MLDLQPRVHLEEVEPRIVSLAFEQELDRAGVAVAGGPGRGDRRRAHALAHGGRQRRRRTLFDDLLMAALQRALALEEVHDVAVVVAEHLQLDVARPFDELLDVERAVAERRRRLAPRRRNQLRRVVRGSARRACPVRRRRPRP